MSFIIQKQFWNVPYENSKCVVKCPQCVLKAYDTRNDNRCISSTEQNSPSYFLSLVQNRETDGTESGQGEPFEDKRLSDEDGASGPAARSSPPTPKSTQSLECASNESYVCVVEADTQTNECDLEPIEEENGSLGSCDTFQRMQIENEELKELVRLKNKEKCYLKNKLMGFQEAEQAFNDNIQAIICEYQKRVAACKQVHRNIILRLQCDKEAKIDLLICRIAELLEDLQTKSEYIRYSEMTSQQQRESLTAASTMIQNQAEATCDELRSENESLLLKMKELQNQLDKSLQINKKLSEAATTGKPTGEAVSALKTGPVPASAKPSTGASVGVASGAKESNPTQSKGNQSEVDDLKRQLAELQLSCEKATREQLNEISKLLQSVKDKDKELSEVKAKATNTKELKDKDDMIQKLMKEMESLKNSATASGLKVETSVKNLIEKDDEIGKLKAEINKLNGAIAQNKKECNDIVNNLKEIICQLKKENAGLKKDVEAVGGKATGKLTSADKRPSTAEKRASCGQRKSSCSAAPDAIAAKSATADYCKEKMLEKLNNEIADLKNALAKCKANSGSSGASGTGGVSVSANCTKLQEENEELKKKIDEFRRGMANLECKYSNMLAKLQNSDVIAQPAAAVPLTRRHSTTATEAPKKLTAEDIECVVAERGTVSERTSCVDINKPDERNAQRGGAAVCSADSQTAMLSTLTFDQLMAKYKELAVKQKECEKSKLAKIDRSTSFRVEPVAAGTVAESAAAELSPLGTTALGTTAVGPTATPNSGASNSEEIKKLNTEIARLKEIEKLYLSLQKENTQLTTMNDSLKRITAEKGVDAGMLEKFIKLNADPEFQEKIQNFEKMNAENGYLKDKNNCLEEELASLRKKLHGLLSVADNAIGSGGGGGGVGGQKDSKNVEAALNQRLFAEKDSSADNAVENAKTSSGRDTDKSRTTGESSSCAYEKDGSSPTTEKLNSVCHELALLQLANDRLIAENEALRLINDSLPSCEREMEKLHMEINRLNFENCRLQERCRRLHEKLMHLGVSVDESFNRCMKKAKEKSHVTKTAPPSVKIPCKIFDTASLFQDIAETKKLSRAINEAYYEERLNQPGNKTAHHHICGTGVNFNVGITKTAYTTRETPTRLLSPSLMCPSSHSSKFTPPVKERSSNVSSTSRGNTSSGKRIHRNTNIELNLDAGLSVKSRHYESKKSGKK